MKKLYRMVMSRGEDFVFEEDLVKKIMSSDLQMLQIPIGNRLIWINKAHIVCVFLDREETSREKSKDFLPDLPADDKTISIEKITELKEKARQLSAKKSIEEKPQEEKKDYVVNLDDLPF